MRWGLAGRLRGKDPRLQAGLDRYLVGPAEPAELKARATTARHDPLREPPTVKLERLTDPGEVVPAATRELEMQPIPEAPGLWQLALEHLEEGHWRVTASHRAPELAGLAEARDLIVRSQAGVEGLDLAGDLAALTRLAHTGGHRAGTMDQAESIVQDLCSRLKPRVQEHRETIRLWNSYLSMGAVIALLCTEWVLRKRQGLP
jgi:hypothetical protein